MTNEFSICLLADDKTTELVNVIRSTMLPSPYRDDVPHITLLRGISSTNELHDDELFNFLHKMLDLDTRLPLTLHLENVENRSTTIYSPSAMAMIKTNEALINLRKRTCEILQANDYTIEPAELKSYNPHLTLRLGVKLHESQKNHEVQLLMQNQITFNDWMILRLEKDGRNRVMHQVGGR